MQPKSDLDGAIKICEDHLKEDDTNIKYLLLAGDLYLQRLQEDDLKKAKKVYTKASIESFHANPFTWKGLGKVAFEEKDFVTARKRFEEAKKLMQAGQDNSINKFLQPWDTQTVDGWIFKCNSKISTTTSSTLPPGAIKV